MTDYRQLLIRYMAKIIDAEGFALADNWTFHVQLTEEELRILGELEVEARGAAGWNEP